MGGPSRVPPGAGRWWPVAALIVGVTLARGAYLLWACPYSLIEDEAHYWEWSRRLDWSYYSKGPGIAWVIAASTRVFGTAEWAVRLPVVIASALAAAALAGLAWDVFRDRRTVWSTAACFCLVPMFQLTSLLATIDMPYVACWSAAAWAAWRALRRRSWWAWPALGAAVGAGFLFKYTILLLIPGVVVFAVIARARLALARRWPIGLVLACVALVIGTLPVLIWNQREGWPTVRHLLGHLGTAAGDMPVSTGESPSYSPLWTLEFVGMQLGMVGPVLALVWWGYRRAMSGRAEDPANADGARFLAWCGIPVVVFYLLVTFFAEAEGNWAMAGYTTWMPLAGWGVSKGLDEFRAKLRAWRERPEPRPKEGWFTRQPETVPQLAWHWTVGFGIVAGALMLRVDWLAKLPGVGAWIPAGRLMGGPTIAAHVARVEDDLRARSGLEPFVISQHYGAASRLAYYLPGRPVVYCSSSRMHGRRTQYDLWDQTDLDDLGTLRGRPAVMIGAEFESWKRVFERVEPIGKLEGDHKKNRSAFIGLGYKGFPKPRVRPTGKDQAATTAEGAGR